MFIKLNFENSVLDGVEYAEDHKEKQKWSHVNNSHLQHLYKESKYGIDPHEKENFNENLKD